MGWTHIPKQTKTIYLFFISPLYFVSKEYGQTPLDTAAFNGHEQIVQLLLEKGGANVNSQRKVLFFFKSDLFPSLPFSQQKLKTKRVSFYYSTNNLSISFDFSFSFSFSFFFHSLIFQFFFFHVTEWNNSSLCCYSKWT